MGRRMSPAAATYVYGLAAGRRPPALRPRLAGLPGTGPVRMIAVEPGWWLVAADAPLTRYDAPAIERSLRDLDWVSVCALAHEAVVEEAARRGTVIPMKLFTLFSTDARAVAHVCRRRRTLERVLRRIEGSQEWGVRVTAAPATGTGGGARARLAAGPGAGRRFLLEKKRAQDARRGPAAGRAAVRRMLRPVVREAVACREQPVVSGAPVVLDAALLVRRARTSGFRRAVKSMSAALAPRGYAVTLTGPWPAYNFVTARA
jgi:hypothetical protein